MFVRAGSLGRDRTSADCDCAFRSGFRDSPRVHGLRGLGRSNPAVSWAGCCDSFRVPGQSVRARATVGQVLRDVDDCSVRNADGGGGWAGSTA